MFILTFLHCEAFGETQYGLWSKNKHIHIIPNTGPENSSQQISPKTAETHMAYEVKTNK